MVLSPPTASIGLVRSHRAGSFTTAAGLPPGLRPQDEDQALNFEMLSGTAARPLQQTGKMPNARASKGGGQPDQPGLISRREIALSRRGAKAPSFYLTKADVPEVGLKNGLFRDIELYPALIGSPIHQWNGLY